MWLVRSAFVATAIAIFLGLGWFATIASDFRSSDFFCYWSGARFVAEGRDPYQEDIWRAATTGERPWAPFCTGAYPGPLWTAVLMVPLGLLPFAHAAALWMALSLAAVVAGMALLRRASGGPRSVDLFFYLLVVFSQPFWILLIGGQFSGVLLLATGVLAWGLTRDHDRAAGIALASFAVKPQLVLLFAPVVFLRSLADRHRSLAMATIATAAIVFAITLAVRASWPLEWIVTASSRAAIVPYLATSWGLAGDVLGDSRWALVLIALVAIGVLALVRGVRLGALDAAALAMPLSLFASPHAWSYDYLLLALPWSQTLSHASRLVPQLALVFRLLIIVSASLLPWFMYLVAFARYQETLSAVVPAISTIVVALALRASAGLEPRHSEAPTAAAARVAERIRSGM